MVNQYSTLNPVITLCTNLTYTTNDEVGMNRGNSRDGELSIEHKAITQRRPQIIRALGDSMGLTLFVIPAF